MFRLWGKIWKDNHLLSDHVYEESSDDTRTHKVFRGIDALALNFNLGRPIWLDKNIAEFKRHHKTRFGKDCFIEEIEFDCLEIEIIEDDY